jgi:hypothetical protein
VPCKNFAITYQREAKDSDNIVVMTTIKSGVSDSKSFSKICITIIKIPSRNIIGDIGPKEITASPNKIGL